MGRHVVVDHPNVARGFRRATGGGGSAPRLRVAGLLALLEGGDAAGRAFGAFEDEEAEPLFAEVTALGYDLYVVARPGAGAPDDGVGSLLRGVVANAILDAGDDGRRTLVLASDDVGDDGYGTSFVTQVERALAWGWAVEVWSWTREAIPAYLELRIAGRDVTQRSFADHAASLAVGDVTGEGGDRGGSSARAGEAGPTGRTVPGDGGRTRYDRVEVAGLGAEQPWV